MPRTKQPELLLQADMIPCLKSQGFFADKTSDRFKAGKPDVRLGHKEWGPLDVELKFCTLRIQDLWYEAGIPREFNTGLSPLQAIKLKEMNQHGIPSVGLVYVQAMDQFLVTNLLRDLLSGAPRYVSKGAHKGNVIDGHALMRVAKRYLEGLYD